MELECACKNIILQAHCCILAMCKMWESDNEGGLGGLPVFVGGL